MYWNYRIIKDCDGCFGVHEVYYNEKNEPWGATETPITFRCSKDEEPRIVIANALKKALKDIKNKKVPILNYDMKFSKSDWDEEIEEIIKKSKKN